MKFRTSMWMFALAGVGVWSIGACDGGLSDVGGPLSLSLTVTPTAGVVGDTILVETSAVGTRLAGTIIEFGNGRVDSIAALGAASQGVRITDHFYSASGTYTIVARIEDEIKGTLVRTRTIQIADP